MIDWWGLGILIFEMCNGSPPYTDLNINRCIKDIVTKKTPQRDHFSKKLKSIINMLLEKDPEKRLGSPATGGVDSIKKHPFFEDLDWDAIMSK